MVGLAVSGLALGSLAGQLTGRAAAQGTVPGAGSPPPAKTPAAPHVHATPKGWRFAWPKGDPAKGRDVFQKLECYSCHEVRGERFPAPSDSERTGPELSTMGPDGDGVGQPGHPGSVLHAEGVQRPRPR